MRSRRLLVATNSRRVMMWCLLWTSLMALTFVAVLCDESVDPVWGPMFIFSLWLVGFVGFFGKSWPFILSMKLVAIYLSLYSLVPLALLACIPSLFLSSGEAKAVGGLVVAGLVKPAFMRVVLPSYRWLSRQLGLVPEQSPPVDESEGEAP